MISVVLEHEKILFKIILRLIFLALTTRGTAAATTTTTAVAATTTAEVITTTAAFALLHLTLLTISHGWLSVD